MNVSETIDNALIVEWCLRRGIEVGRNREWVAVESDMLIATNGRPTPEQRTRIGDEVAQKYKGCSTRITWVGSTFYVSIPVQDYRERYCRGSDGVIVLTKREDGSYGR